MDSYVVRIYRRYHQPGNKMLGVVIGVNGEEDETFSTADELWSILYKGLGKTDENVKKNPASNEISCLTE
jgi:hypothetical protein